MKTIPTNRSSLLTSLFVVGGLVAFYFYRKNGGKMAPLIASGTDFARNIGEKISSVAPAVGSLAASSSSRMNSNSREVSQIAE